MLQKSLSTILTASVLSIGLTIAAPVQASSDRTQIRQMETSKPSKKTADEAQTSSAAHGDLTDRRGTVVRSMGPRDEEPQLMMDFEPRRNGIRE